MNRPLLACALLVLAACEFPIVSLGRRAFIDGSTADASEADAAADRDAQSDEDLDEPPRPCQVTAECTDRDEPLCDSARGFCVECLSDADCKQSEVCEPDGECDTP